jgi:hypothetical protein
LVVAVDVAVAEGDGEILGEGVGDVAGTIQISATTGTLSWYTAPTTCIKSALEINTNKQ